MDADKISADSIARPWLKTLTGLLLYVLVYYAIFREFRHVILLIAVIVFHECGHFLVMKAYGYKDVRMLFIPFLGAFVSGKSEGISPAQKSIMILAGPIPGIIVGVILFFIYLAKPNPLLFEGTVLFLLLNGFNLLPVIPLDGGQLLQTLYFENNVIVQISFLLISALVVVLLSWFLHNYLLLVIVLIPILRLRTLYSLQKLRRFMTREGINLNRAYEDLSHDQLESIRKKMLKFYEEEDEESLTEADNQAIRNLTKTLFKANTAEATLRTKFFFTLIWCLGLIFPLIALLYFVSVKQ
ncbi:site-2 protease family protein [Pollutibacter soli]|uniref:site-2 protease family protein n=1 Tax=Pollutibacter soli TaxID=3034157 RepID=UPI0030133FE9